MLDTHSPEPACPQHRPALPPTPRPVLEGWFSHPNGQQGCASPAQAGFAGRAALLQAERAEALCRTVGRWVGHCKVLCNRGSDYVQDSFDQDVTPPRGMAAA